jgi:hypothetical protein
MHTFFKTKSVLQKHLVSFCSQKPNCILAVLTWREIDNKVAHAQGLKYLVINARIAQLTQFRTARE